MVFARIFNLKSSGLAIVAGLFFLVLFGLSSVAQGLHPQTRRAQNQPSPSPTPGKPFFQKMREEQERELNEHGPQPPATSQTGSFSMMAFIRAGWPLVVEYELEEGATADLEIVTLNDRGFHRVKQRLEGTDIGNGVMRDIVKVPAEFGDLQPGTIGISAKLKTPGGTRKADFKLHGLGVGVRTLHALEKRDRHRDEAKGLSLSFLKSKFEANFSAQTAVLQDLDVTPEVIDSTRGQKAEYRFVPAETFGQWAADFSTVTHTIKDGIDITKIKRIQTKEFHSEISGGSEARGDWDGKNARGKFSKGPHQLAVRAWWSAASAGGGASCFRNAKKLITVQ